MESRLTIKNFRVFDESGATIDIKPITILTGANSSGKSTVVKAVFLLNSFLEQIKKAIENGDPIELDGYKLDFTNYPNNLLGRFDKVVHDGSDSKTITFEYTMHSLMLSKDVAVQLMFTSDENDVLNNGFLESIKMRTDDGVFYSSGRHEHSYCNLNIIKEDCFSFLYPEYLARNYYGRDHYFEYEPDSGISEEEYDNYIKSIKNMDDYWRGIDKSRKRDIISFVHIYNRQESLIEEMGVENSLEQLQSKESIFEIPVIDKLAKMSKREVGPYVTSELVDDGAIELNAVSRKIISDFLESDFDNFADYFADAEKRAFEQRFFRFNLSGSVSLLTAQDLSFEQGNLSFIFEDLDEATIKSQLEYEIELLEKQALTFDQLYEAVMLWNKNVAPDGNGVYVYDQPTALDKIRCYHSAYNVLCKFSEMLVREVVCPNWCGNMSYVSSNRVDVRRLYTLDIKDDFSMLLQNYFEQSRLLLDVIKNDDYYNFVISQDRNNYYYEPSLFMNRWIKKFDIGKTITLDLDKEGIGAQIRLHKVEGDDGRILADEGYGITQLVSILLQIETAILSSQRENVTKHWGLDHFDKDNFHYVVNTIAIEEPEIHLHPKLQSLLADMFLEAYEKYNIHFIVETHSEYLIRKTQVFVSKAKYRSKDQLRKKCPFSVYYMPSDGKKPYQMEYRTDGKFSNEFGKGFYDEATDLLFEIL